MPLAHIFSQFAACSNPTVQRDARNTLTIGLFKLLLAPLTEFRYTVSLWMT